MKKMPLACILAFTAFLQSCLDPERLDGNPHPSDAQTQPVAFSVVPTGYADKALATGLVNPTQMEIAPDGRVFVSEQGGRLRVIKNGSLLATPFLSLSVSTTGERGLLGIAFDPDFSNEKYVYVMYTSPSGPHNKVSRFTVSASNSDIADPASEMVLIDLPTGLCDCGWHNGGGVHFGGDGKLYMSVGESTVGSRAQDLNTTMGKVLRINKDGSIPTDNPFYSQTSGSNRSIYALGFRNPYTFAVQPGTGRIFVNDVGNTSIEEINDLKAGKNYGWPVKDGAIGNPIYTDAFFEYSHANGCAISGGDFYNPTTVRFPSDFVGDYFYSDYCGNYIKKLDLATKSVTTFATSVNQPTDVKVGKDGYLYYVARGAGEVRVVTPQGGQAPDISDQPKNATVGVGSTATFSVTASGLAPLSYQWQRNGTDIGGATGQAYSLNAGLSDNGVKFRCIVSNSAGSVTSNEATLTVINSQPPTATITTPTAGKKYSGGNVISFSGNATDPEEGNLPASNLTWEVRFFHNDGNLHFHPFMAPISGISSGSFTIPVQSETSPNVWFRIYLTAIDGSGLKDMDSVDVLPNKVSVTLSSNPAGLSINLDGSPHATPYTFIGVVGIQRNLQAPSPQTMGGSTYQFSSWSDGNAATHDISTPASNTTFTAAFQAIQSTVYEAENAAFTGPLTTTKHPGYSGSGYLDFQNDNGDFVQWTVNAASAGSFSMPIHYATAGAVQVKVTINGVVVNNNFAMPSTNDWAVWGSVNLTSSLVAGTNTIRLTSINVGQPNIDNISVPQGASSGTTYESENAAFSGPLVKTDWPGYTGTGFLDFQSPNGNWVEWTINAPSSGSQVLPIRYANVGDVKVQVTLNGSVINTGFILPSTGGWGTWGSVNLTATLVAGSNKLRLTTVNQGEPNIDNIKGP